jgi:hypothetical protein
MLTLKVGAKGDYQLEWPATDADVIQLGERYLAYEGELSPAGQLQQPDPRQVRDALVSAKAGMELAQAEEIKRSESATAFHNAMAEATPLLKEGIEQLSFKYRDNLAHLERWGLSTKIASRGGVLVSKPRFEALWAEFLISYAAQEQTLPEADRLTTPSLTRLAKLAVIVTQHKAARVTAKSQRKLGVETRSDTARPLLDMLQLACGLLVVMRFDGRVTNALEAWGFKVKERKGAEPMPPPEPQPPTA